MTAPITRTVTGCGECPFLVWDRGDAGRCSLEKDGEQARVIGRRGIDRQKSPAWCPLRTAPVLVTLEAK